MPPKLKLSLNVMASMQGLPAQASAAQQLQVRLVLSALSLQLGSCPWLLLGQPRTDGPADVLDTCVATALRRSLWRPGLPVAGCGHWLAAAETYIARWLQAPSIDVGPDGTLKIYKSFQAYEFNNGGMTRNASPLAAGAAALQQYKVRANLCEQRPAPLWREE